ncbi:MAG: class I SAM-dependent methyltransferase [Nitrososphaerales archaeon]
MGALSEISISLARRGALVTGIDYSDEMIRLAQKHVSETTDGDRLSKNIHFVKADLLEFQPEGKFDVSTLLGVFDYVQNPLPMLNKVKSLTAEQIIASYPAKYTMQMPIRKVWLWGRSCPVYFYTIQGLTKLYEQLGLDYSISKISAGFMVVSGKSEKLVSQTT